MTEHQINTLKTNGWNPNNIVAIPTSLVEKAQTKPKHEATVVEINVQAIQEAFPSCTHLAFVPWLKVNGLWADYEVFASGEETQDINFMGRLDAAKEQSDVENGVEKSTPPPPPVAPKAPEAPETPKAPVIEVDTKPEAEPEPPRFKRYVERLEYMKELNLVHDTLVKGYVNKAKDRFVAEDILKNFDAPDDIIDAEFINFIDQRMAISFEHPDNKKIEDFKDSPTEVPDVTEGLVDIKIEATTTAENDRRHELLLGLGLKYNEKIQEYSSGSIKASYSDLMDCSLDDFNIGVDFLKKSLGKKEEPKKVEEFVETEKPRPEKLTLAQEEDIIKKRVEFLLSKGFVQDKQTYVFSHEKFNDISYMRAVKDVSPKGQAVWDPIAVNIIETLAKSKEVVEDEPTTAPERIKAIAKKLREEETKEVDKVSPEDLEAAAEKFDQLVAEQDNAEPPYVEDRDSVYEKRQVILSTHGFQVEGNSKTYTFPLQEGEISISKNDMKHMSENEFQETLEEALKIKEDNLKTIIKDNDEIVVGINTVKPSLSELENDEEEDEKSGMGLVNAVAGSQEPHPWFPEVANPKKSSIERHFEKELDFANKMKNAFENYSEAIIALQAIKSILASDENDEAMIKQINDVINYL